MKKLGIIANDLKPRAPVVVAAIVAKAAQLGIDLCAVKETAALVEGLESVESGEMFDRVDAIIALGGDGTMLRAVRQLGSREIPLMGFNIGSLGFMTSVAEDDIDRAMDCLASDDFIRSHRTVQEIVVIKEGRETDRYRALNDAVVSSGASNRVVTLAVSIDGNPVTSYVCDGIIVSTPTGSTGHNLSAGGPIVTPEARNFVISLVCPHTLSSRPLVVQDDSEILIQGQDLKESGLLLSVDGQVSQMLHGSEHIIVRAGKPDVQFIHLPGQHFFQVLSQKLGWKGSSSASP